MAGYMEIISDRYIADEDDFTFGDYGKVCCSEYNFQDEAEIEKKEELLNIELANNRFFSRGWEKAMNMEKDPGMLSENELLSVVTYSLENPKIYQEFNEQTREVIEPANDDDFQFKGLHYFLHSAVNKLSNEEGPFHVYRGVTHKVTAHVGQDFHFDSFASTSTLIDIAKKFGTKHRPEFNGEKITIFDIPNTFRGAHIGQFAQYAEHEVLIPPCEKFKVVRIEKKKEEWLIDDDVKRLKTTIIHLESQSKTADFSDSELYAEEDSDSFYGSEESDSDDN